MVYNAKYLDGKSSRPHPCRVEFLPFEIRIHYQDELLGATQVHWELSLLHPNISSQPGKIHTLVYGTFPYQSLQVEDENLVATLQKTYPQLNLAANRHYAFFSWNKPLLFGLIAAFLGCIALIYFAALPLVADVCARYFPLEYEIQMGQALYEQNVADYKINSQASKAATDFLRELVGESEYPLQVDVVRSDDINAYALPGGHIIVFDSIVHSMKSYDELAALLGHEYAHVKLRHSTRNIFRSLSGMLFLTIITGDMSGVSAVVLENANGLNSLHYSRSLEEEADEEGFKIMQKKKVNPEGMLKLFNTLQAASDIEVPDFLSTHPATDKRIEKARERIEQQEYSPTENKALLGAWQRLEKSIH